MKLILDARSYEYEKLKDFLDAQNKDHLIYQLLTHFKEAIHTTRTRSGNDSEYEKIIRECIQSIDLNEMYEYRIGERVLDLNMKDKKEWDDTLNKWVEIY